MHVISAFESQTDKSHLALHQNTTQKCSIEISLSTTLGAKTFIDMQYNLTFNQADVNLRVKASKTQQKVEKVAFRDKSLGDPPLEKTIVD